MKKITLVLMIIFIFIFSFNVKAIENKNDSLSGAIPVSKQTENDQMEKFYEYISNMKTKHELLKDIDAKNYIKDFLKTGDGKISFKKLTNGVLMYTIRELYASLKLLALIVMISLICALLTNIQKAFSSENLSNIAYFACYSLLIIIMAKSFYIGVDLARGTIKEMTDFMTALIPILIMLIASVGGFVEAATMDPIILGTITISAKLFMDIIIPLICITFVLQFVNNMSNEYKINNLTKLLNQVAMWGQGIIVTLFIGIITVRGIAAKTIDQVTARTAKFAVDNFVPIVGKSLSDAISTVAGYSILLKNALSSIGLVVIIAVMLFPIIKLFIMAFLYKITGALIEPISDGRLVNCLTSAGDSLILITSCLISVSVMFFIMIAIVASAGKALIGG